MGIPVELPQLGLRHTTPLAPADARRKGLGADAKLESVTNRALPTYGNHYERRSSATATSESRSPSPSVSADAASAVLARAGQRLLDALPRLESTLERPVDPAEHLDFRNDFLQVAVAVEDFMDLATEGARNGTLPEQLAENFRTLASNRRVVADGETMSQLWDRMGFGIGGDYAFLERDTMRTGLLEYCSRVRQAINDYGYATDNDQLAWAFEVPLAVPGDPTPPGTPGWMRSPSYRIAVSRGVVDPPGAEPAQDRQQVAKTGKGALERLQAVGHSIVARLRSMFAGIGNVKDRLVHRKTDAGMSAFEALSFHCLQDQAQANLLTGLPRLASRLQAPVAKMDDAGFERDFNRVQAGMEGLAMLSSRNALEGVVPKRLAREIGVLANTGTVANGETGWQLADRMLHNDFSFLRTADGHRELSAHVGKAHDAFLKYARATGDHRLVSRLEADGVDHVDGSALDATPTRFEVIRDHLLPALPRIEHLLQADISHNAYREFHADLHGIQMGMEAIATLAEQGVRDGALLPEVSETIESLVNGSAVVADGQTLMQVWQRIGAGDYTFLESPRVRDDMARFIAKTRDAAVDFADSIGNPRFARELEASWLEGAA